MARAFPTTPTTEFAPPPGDWQALRGELVALLDQVEGQYARTQSADPALANFAQRMRDLRYQVADADPDDRRREALRSVSRQMERFTNERGGVEAPISHADNILQSAIQQIRARTQERPAAAAAPRMAPPAFGQPPAYNQPAFAPQPQVVVPPPQPMAPPAPRFDDLAMAMATLTGRLGNLETELKSQRNAGSAQVREIADQVGQLSHVVELIAGAVGETGQVKRLEGQIAGLAAMIGDTPKVDMAQFTERLDVVAATVDRLADLQVQQIRNSVREAEAAPEKDAAASRTIQAIELGVRNIYDRIDGLEAQGVKPADLDQLTDVLGRISGRLEQGQSKPDTLLTLVDALNGRINEIEDRGDMLGALRADIVGLRDTVLQALEPRFATIEGRIGDLGERLASRAAEPPAGISQIEAQVRQLVARMDQTGEQLAELARLYSSAEETRPAPDYENLASLAALRAFEQIQDSQPAHFDAIAERAALYTVQQMAERQDRQPAPDYDGVAERAAARAFEQMAARLPTPQAPDYEGVAERAARRAFEQMARQEPPTPDYDAVAERAALRAMERMAARPVETPDFEALANLAAARTSAAMATNPTPEQRLSSGSLAAIEERLTRLVEGITKARTPDTGIDVVRAGIERVEQRMQQLESSLARREPAPVVAPAPAPAAIVAAAPAPVSVPDRPALAETSPVEADPADAMPRSPGKDAPLTEFGFPDLTGVAAALQARTAPRKRHPGIEQTADDVTPAVAADTAQPTAAPRPAPAKAGAPAFDPANVPRPPRPMSSFETDANSNFVDVAELPAPRPAPVAAEPDAARSSRNTFIEAARRAAQRQNAQMAAAPEANSAFGRALSRFQPGAKPEAVPAAPAAPQKPSRAEKAAAKEAERARARASRMLAGSRPAVAEPAPATETQGVIADGVAVEAQAPRESFLLRHRRAILLAASVVAISFMAINLYVQHTAADTAGPAAPAADSKPTNVPAPPTAKPAGAIIPAAEAAPLVADNAAPAAAPAAPAASLIDPTTTASTDPGEAMRFTPTGTEAAMPPALSPTSPVIAPAPLAGAQATAPTPTPAAPVAVASLDASVPANSPAAAPGALDSPVKLDLPPDNVGPLDLRQAAANGDARAQFEIAAIYSEGRTIAADYKLAAAWYERAAAQGFAPAQYRLGNLYENGKGVTKDLEQAKLWYQRAAEAGNRMAMHNLAALYAGGQFGKQDFASAAEWFQRAADLGMKDSQFNLGMLYARGLGVPQSLETSYKFFALAATGGDTEAGKARDDMGRSLDAAALKRAQDAVAAWKLGAIDLAANFAPIGTWSKSFDPGPAVTTKEIVAKVQVALMRLGFDVGTPDGHMGAKTTTAIKAFEAGTGMSQVGAINPRLLAVLGSQPV